MSMSNGGLMGEWTYSQVATYENTPGFNVFWGDHAFSWRLSVVYRASWQRNTCPPGNWQILRSSHDLSDIPLTVWRYWYLLCIFIHYILPSPPNTQSFVGTGGSVSSLCTNVCCACTRRVTLGIWLTPWIVQYTNLYRAEIPRCSEPTSTKRSWWQIEMPVVCSDRKALI